MKLMLKLFYFSSLPLVLFPEMISPIQRGERINLEASKYRMKKRLLLECSLVTEISVDFAIRIHILSSLLGGG